MRDHLERFGIILDHLLYLGHLGSSGIIGGHLGSSGIIWDHLGVGLDLGPGPRHNFLAIGSKISGVKSEACATKQNKGKRPYMKNPHIINKLRQGLFKTHKFNREGGQAPVCKSVSFTMQK